jgi:hypothetical protein
MFYKIILDIFEKQTKNIKDYPVFHYRTRRVEGFAPDRRLHSRELDEKRGIPHLKLVF